MPENIRLDQWLWAVRLFKTRTLATQACRSGKISIAGVPLKPSHHVRIDEEFDVKMAPIVRRFRVKAPARKRVSATLAKELVEEITAPEELEKLEWFRRDRAGFIFGQRERGSGRPTKRERRQLEKIRPPRR